MNLVRILAVVFALPALRPVDSSPPDAMTLLQYGKANEAIQVLNVHIQGHQNDARAYNLMSRVYFQLEHWDDAIRSAERSVALAPQESAYHQWLARAYGKKAESAGPFAAFSLVRKVKNEFEKSVSLDPEGKNLSAREDLAEFYIEAPFFMGGDKGKARRLAEFVMNHDAALAAAIRGRIDERQSARDNAEQEYKTAIQASNAPARYWVELAAFYRRRGRLEEMESAITKSLTAPRRDSLPLFDAASILLAAGRNFPGAVQMLKQYLAETDPAEDGPAFQAHQLLGTLLEKQGDLQAAAGEYRAALALASEYHPAQQALARIGR